MRISARTSTLTAAIISISVVTVGISSRQASADEATSHRVAAVREMEHSQSTPLSETQLATLLNAIDARGEFDGDAARASGLDSDVIDEFAAGYVVGGGVVVNATPDRRTIDSLTPRLETFSRRGQNRSDFTGYQGNLYLNSCVTGDVIGKLSTGAAAAGLAGMIAAETGIGGLAGGLLAGILAIGAGQLSSCAATGTGTVVHYIPLPTAFWCTAQ